MHVKPYADMAVAPKWYARFVGLSKLRGFIQTITLWILHRTPTKTEYLSRKIDIVLLVVGVVLAVAIAQVDHLMY